MKHTILKAVIVILTVFSGYILNAQSGVVSGTLRDDAGDGLPSVSILVKGTTRGTMTLSDGTYSIECNVGEVLVFSYIGMETKEVEVNSGMFTAVYEKPITETKTVQKNPVTPIRSYSYSQLLNKKTIQLNKYTDMASATYKWSYKKYRYNNDFQIMNYKKISKTDSLVFFEKSPEPLKYSIEFNSFTVRKSVLNLPALQKSYAQGRPSGGENTWFGPGNNEVFAWGPKIENLAFDGSDYIYDQNGRLIPKSAGFTDQANVYNPYDIFDKGMLYKNRIQVKLQKDENSMNIAFIDKKEKGALKTLNSSSNIIKLDFRNNLNNQNIRGGFQYFTGKNNFANTNALWTKTMTSVLLTPPTFDNTQGFLLYDDSQRSSAVESKNNPYFLLENNISEIKNSVWQTYLHYNISPDGWDFISELNFLRDINHENINIPYNTNGHNNSFIQNKEIRSSDFNFKLYANNYQSDYIEFTASAIYNFQELNYDNQIDGNVENKINSYRNSVNITEGIELTPEYSNDFILNLKNNSYIAGNRRKWFLPRVTFAINIPELTYGYWLPYINITGAYHKSVAEYPLYLEDKSHESLWVDKSQLNSFLELNDLFFNKDLELETRQSFDIGIDLTEHRLFNTFSIRAASIYNYTKAENSIFPVLNDNTFALQNVASIEKHSWESNFYISTRSKNYEWEANYIFSRYRSNVLKLYGNDSMLPIAGFSSVSKNLIEGEPVGVLVGSVYQRNDEGQTIIGNDGFPLVSDDKEIIGDPNPDYYMALENKFTFYHFSLSVLIDHQKGGDIWNGTGNILDYHGLSKKTAEERAITDYIFQGVDENGNQNTIPVDFANPENGIEGNRWFRYGYEGVAEDAVEDATWFRIKEINLGYSFKTYNMKFFQRLALSVYMNNVFIVTKYSGASPITHFNNYIQGQGIDHFNFPEFREIGFRLKVQI